jgi:competence protein ComEC
MSKITKIALSILIIVLISIWAAIAEAPSHNFQLSVLNVGQGDSILIQTPSGKNILVDGGPDNSVLDELGKKIPFYNRNIDAVILTHPHADHVFGLVEVLKRYQVKNVYLTGITQTTNEYLEFLKTIKDQKIPAKDLKAGDELTFDAVHFQVFWPLQDLSGQKMDNLNLSSIVLKVSYNNFSALLLGDLEKDCQAEMIKNQSIGKIDVIKIAHHGSSNGLNGDLIDQIKPSLAIISVGAGNMYGHPAFSTITALEKRNINIKRTDRDGTVTVTSDGQKFW